MQLNQTLETSTFELPEHLILNPQTVLIKSYQNEDLMNEIIKPTFHLQPQQPLPYIDPSPTSKLTLGLENIISSITPPLPYLISSIGSIYVFAQTNSPTLQIHVNSEEKIQPFKIHLSNYISLFHNQGIQALTFLSSSILAVTSYNTIIVYGILLNNNKIQINFTFQLQNNKFTKLTKQPAQIQKKSNFSFIFSAPSDPLNLICGSHDGKFLFVGSRKSQFVSLFSLLQFVKIREFRLKSAPFSLDCNQNGTLIAAGLKNQIQIIDVISGRISTIQNVKQAVCCFYKATLFKQENVTIPPVQELSFENLQQNDVLVNKYQSIVYQTMLSMQQQTNHRSLDYQSPEFEFIAFSQVNDVSLFVYSIQRQQLSVQASPCLAFDFSRQQGFSVGGRISQISWCDGVLGAVCDGNCIIAATRESGDGVSGIVSSVVVECGDQCSICVGRSIVVGGNKGVYCFDIVE
ncbi:hypothetical protein SS50377_26976 [Spironucleus salmonicida]|uniref:Uncharacterized protein n=1 Tax=Spironucleus salmonicida TaxID=348837 RepID=V6LTA4_9EUKA|nr:hypothetical protein SS50377_26976 [Spironucleus salmonicida]|eukprot:EST47488.1 Hypothetical protein SS50377_12473 [Spironucleus salmonicida]